MLFREASKIASRRCTGPVRGNINEGQIVSWEDTKVKYTFIPEHAYTKEGMLIYTDLRSGKKKQVYK